MSDPYDPQLTLQENAAKQQKLREEAEEITTLRAQLEAARASWDEAVAVAHIYDERNVALRAQLETAKAALKEARDDVADWGAYASEYFRTKWDLKGDLARIDATLAALEGKPAP